MPQIVSSYVSSEVPAPHFVGDAIGEQLMKLLNTSNSDSNPDLTFQVRGEKRMSYPRRRLVRHKCQVRSDGIIILVVRLVGACSCPHSEERFYFQPQACDSVMNLVVAKRIKELTVGYPTYSSTFQVEVVS